jgi:signal transduction histidine kinase/FixJ family two-component response regulator
VSGPAALELAAERVPDLILLDVMMPGMDGFEVCRRLRGDLELGEVPVLLVTAMDDRDSRIRGLESGADDFVTKPIDRGEVRARVRTITRLNRFGKLHAEMEQSRRAAAGMEEYARQLTLLREVDRAVLTGGTPPEIAAGVLALLRGLVPYRHAAILTSDQWGSGITVLAEKGEVAPLGGEGACFGTEELGLDLTSGSCETLSTVIDLSGSGVLPVLLGRLRNDGLGSVLVLPLIALGRFLGALLLGSERADGISEDHARVAQEVAGSVSLAIAHALLLERATAGRRQLEALSRKLLRVREEESRRIACELHDEIGQILMVLKLSLSRHHGDETGLPGGQSVGGCLELVDDLIAKVRGLSLELHPSLLNDFGVVSALRRHVETLVNQTGIAIGFEADRSIGRLDGELETVCFRVVQESLTNVMRHARASQSKVALKVCGDELVISVFDDGVGFDTDAALERAVSGSSLGMLGMRERVSLAGGSLSFRSAPGRGSEVRAVFPLAGKRR